MMFLFCFRRSHCFRELLVANLEKVMILTVETDAAKPLPRPRSTALSLKKLALTTIREWAKNYGSGYKKLNLGISFLKNCKKVDLNAMALEETAELNRQRELKRRKQHLQNERFKKVVDELNGNFCNMPCKCHIKFWTPLSYLTLFTFTEKQPDIISALTEMENCISLLLPRPEDFFIENDAEMAGSNNECKKGKSPELSLGQSSSKEKEGMSGCSEDDQSLPSDSEEDENCGSKNPIFDFRKYGIINPHFSITLKVDPGM